MRTASIIRDEWQYIPKDKSEHHTRRRENLKSHKAKAVPLHTTKVLGEWRHSSYLLSTSALFGSVWSASSSDRALGSGKGPPVPIVQEAGWAPEPVWTRRLQENLSPLPGIDLCRTDCKRRLHSRCDSLQICLILWKTLWISDKLDPGVQFFRTCRLKWTFTFLWQLGIDGKCFT
jgi:hypothetical protein